MTPRAYYCLVGDNTNATPIKTGDFVKMRAVIALSVFPVVSFGMSVAAYAGDGGGESSDGAAMVIMFIGTTLSRLMNLF
jgi:hypothetical protein